MASDTIYEKCSPILKDEALDEEEKTEKLEDLVRQETSLSGKLLENAVLDILWRSRNASTSSPTSPPSRHTVIRKTSPAPWQVSRGGTPLTSSPRSSAVSPAPAFNISVRPSPFRAKSSSFAPSPFTSPRPSPRASFASPQIPHSPSLNAYEFSETGAPPDIYGDYGSDNVDWLVNEDAVSNASSSYTGDGYFPNHASDWVSSQTMEMSPYDILRSVIRDEKSDEEIEKVLEANSYDLSAAIMSLMESQNLDAQQVASSIPDREKTYLVGKSMSPRSRPATPAGQAKSKIPCRYWLSTGQCLRADCRFSHDLTNHVCKYWLAGNCLAGDSCIFSHDPSAMMASLSMNASSYAGTPSESSMTNVQDYNSFPSLQNSTSQQTASAYESSLRHLYPADDSVPPPPGFTARPGLAPEFIPSQPHSRPSSRHQSPAPRRADLSMDDSEAFPTLGTAIVKTKKHHGKRGGHGHKDKDANAGSLADIVRMAPSPLQSPRKVFRQASYTGSREYGAAAQAIPPPEHIPWLETGANANKAYLKARQLAIKHGGARNKFLQSAAQAWHRNDVRAAKALSLRGQSENDLMREAHREAARCLYDERNPASSGASTDEEVYVDLHGLHPAEAVSYLAAALAAQRSHGALHRNDTGPNTLYAIVGTGHHSKAGRDKVGRAVKAFLADARYVVQEFGVPGDRGGNGGILGIDVASGDEGARATAVEDFDAEGDGDTEAPALQHGKIRILKAGEADDP